MREQLGREPTTPFTVVARCTGGHPLVIRNAPLDAEGHPFPTTFWLTCPDAVRAVARLESAGWIKALDEDPAFADGIARAHDAYARERARDLPEARSWGGVGGARRGMKCLHAHYAFHLAGGEDDVGAWVAGRVEPIHPEERRGRVAAVDQGTNSIRLLVAEPGGAGFTELARDMVITRLGQGVDATGVLADEAVDRTLAVLATYVRRARALGAERIRVGATSAVRDASNVGRFAEEVRRLARSDLEVITGDHEAALSFLGATWDLGPERAPFAVIDVGGGSTELVVGEKPGRAGSSRSTRMGSVRFTERFLASDPPAAEELARLIAEAERLLDQEVDPAVPVREASTLIAVGGTATTAQAVAMGLEVDDPDAIDRSTLALADAERTLERLARMTVAERSALSVMPPGRGEVIVAGVAILVAAMRRFGFDAALVSETDILDGLVLELLGIG